MNMTLAQYVALRDALISAAPNAMGSVSIGGHTVTWVTLKEFRDHLTWLEGIIGSMQRMAAGGSRVDFAVANLSGN